VNSQHTGACAAVCSKNVVDRVEITDGHLLVNTNDYGPSNYSMTRDLQSTLESSVIKWAVLQNHLVCIAHVIHLAIGAFMISLCAKGCTKSSEAHKRNQQFGENESIDIGKSQRLRKEGNAKMNTVSFMRLGSAKMNV
jgi:hypothetical protein